MKRALWRDKQNKKKDDKQKAACCVCTIVWNGRMLRQTANSQRWKVNGLWFIHENGMEEERSII
jgi:hypothetical protein